MFLPSYHIYFQRMDFMKYKRKKTNVSKHLSHSQSVKKSVLKRQITISLWLVIVLFSLPQLGLVKMPVIKSIFTYGSKTFKDVTDSSMNKSKFLKNTGDYIYNFCFGYLKDNKNTKVMASPEKKEIPKENPHKAVQKTPGESSKSKKDDSDVVSDASVLSDATPSAEINLFSPIWPCAGEVSSEFGNRIHPVTGVIKNHNGIDIAVAEGTEVYACDSGLIDFAGYNDGSGNYVVISHTDGYTSLYLHLSKLMVQKGDSVQKGDLVGLSGSTGIATGPHLHFEIKKDGIYQNPREVIK